MSALLIALFGWLAVPFLVIHHAWAYWLLTSANYIEHYGLLREKLPNGKYEHQKQNGKIYISLESDAIMSIEYDSRIIIPAIGCGTT